MTEERVKLIIGGLLHDIGKVIYRQGDDHRKHSKSGRDYLLETAGIQEKEILDCVEYHHADALKHAKLSEDSLAYLVYMADNIASAADRREREAEETGFEITTPLQPVFNILNGNHGEKYYRPLDLSREAGINMPTGEKIPFDIPQYKRIVERISDNLKGIEWTPEYLNSLLEVLESNLSYIPSSTSKKEQPDISLYDHLKLTAGLACCMEEYLRENGRKDYRTELFINGKSFYEEKVFQLASMDVSGIQKFIYTIASKNALKTLRARSFYLEIMMEHIIDLLLERLEYSRSNLLYSGGGHCYILMANTEKDRKIFDEFLTELNEWFLENFQISLYIAGAYAECSSNDLKNVPDGAYADIFQRIADGLSNKKSNRYSAKQILWLNQSRADNYERECRVCKRVGRLMPSEEEDGTVCPLCHAMEQFSAKILHGEFFTILKDGSGGGLLLPGEYCLVADDAASLRKKMEQPKMSGFVRAYSKNNQYTGKNVSTKLWVGDYTNGMTFEQLAKAAEGIDRIGVLRADVDNLGYTFVSGFENKENQNRYVTLSRTATLSRQLSLFFKYHINQILRKPDFFIGGDKREERCAAIVYSGGDDVFIVGAWNDVVELAVDLRKKFSEYTDNTLTISAGIGIYHDSYPISVMAEETAGLEDASKELPGKNAVTLFEDGESHILTTEEGDIKVSDGTYSWEEFEQEVIGEKYQAVREFFDQSEERGKAFLYRLLDLIRNQGERINFARFVYLLSRMEPGETEGTGQKELYHDFSGKMYRWVQEEKSRRQLKTAMTIYTYMTREMEGE